jgi:hypothetical protein
MAEFIMELHCHLSDALDDTAKKAVVEATGLAARDYMRSVAGGDVRAVNLRGASPEEGAVELPLRLLERAAVVAEEYGWDALAAELRTRAGRLSHQAGPFWHEHRSGGQVLRHAHVGGDASHGYYDHREDR